MRYLITGSAGFIGFHLAQRLLDEGHEVTGFDAMTTYYDVTLKEARNALLTRHSNFTSVFGQLEDAASLNRAADLAKPDIIVHLAAQAGVRYSLENPKAYIDSNLIGSWNVFELAKNVKPQHLLLASTSSIYGLNPKVPFTETDKADEPMSLYAATKKGMEAMAHAYSNLHHVPTTAFRFFTVYGPWGRPDMALFKFTDAILSDRPIEVYGEGKMERDFTYISDLIEAITRLMPLLPADTPVPFRIVNIGGGQPIGLMTFIETLERALGKPAIRKMLPMQQGDVPRTHASPELLKQLTGFCPQMGLAQGIGAFVKWYRDYYRK
jgi:UDP-glucuronate 4-epimerase